MNKQVLDWLIQNKRKTFSSPRDEVFTPRKPTKTFEIKSILRDRVYIKFEGMKYLALPLGFEMFTRVLEYLEDNKPRAIRLGAKLAPPYDKDTLESIIWKTPYPIGNTPYKASPHVCDILCLVGLLEYTEAVNPITGRQVQAVKLK